MTIYIFHVAGRRFPSEVTPDIVKPVTSSDYGAASNTTAIFVAVAVVVGICAAIFLVAWWNKSKKYHKTRK